MGEMLQSVQSHYPKPFFINYCIRSAPAWGVIVAGALMYRRVQRGEKVAWHDVGWHLSPLKALRAAFIVNLAAASCNWFWYLSLPRTGVAANATIFQVCVSYRDHATLPNLHTSNCHLHPSTDMPPTVCKCICIHLLILLAQRSCNIPEDCSAGPVHWWRCCHHLLKTSSHI